MKKLMIALAATLIAANAFAAATPIDLSSLKDTDQVNFLVTTSGQCSHEGDVWVGANVVRTYSKPRVEGSSHRFRISLSAKEIRDLARLGRVSLDLSSICDAAGAKIEVQLPAGNSTFRPTLSDRGLHEARFAFRP